MLLSGVIIIMVYLFYLYNLLGRELPMGIFNRMKEPVFLKEEGISMIIRNINVSR